MDTSILATVNHDTRIAVRGGRVMAKSTFLSFKWISSLCTCWHHLVPKSYSSNKHENPSLIFDPDLAILSLLSTSSPISVFWLPHPHDVNHQNKFLLITEEHRRNQGLHLESGKTLWIAVSQALSSKYSLQFNRSPSQRIHRFPTTVALPCMLLVHRVGGWGTSLNCLNHASPFVQHITFQVPEFWS